MPSTARQQRSQKGSYYKNRTKAYLEARGWAVGFMERMMWIPSKAIDPASGRPKLIPVKRDQFGSDLIAMNGTELVFVQVKFQTKAKSIAEARHEFANHPFPPTAQRWVVVWEPRAREPEIVDCTEDVPTPQPLPIRPKRVRASGLF